MATLLDVKSRLQTTLPVTVVSGLSDLSRNTVVQTLLEGKSEIGVWKVPAPEMRDGLENSNGNGSGTASDLQYREALIYRLRKFQVLPHWSHLVVDLAPEVDNQLFCELVLENPLRGGRRLTLSTVVTAVDARQFDRELFADESVGTWPIRAARAPSDADADENVLPDSADDAVDLADLLVAQVEYCDVVVVTDSEAAEAKSQFPVIPSLRALQPRAHLVHWPRDTRLDWILDTTLFHPELTPMGCGWRRVFHDAIDAFDQPTHMRPGRSSIVFRRRRPVHPERFYAFIDAWPDTVLRSFGTVWLASQSETPFTLSQAGLNHFVFVPDGCWVASLHPIEIADSLASNPQAAKYWDRTFGDRCTEIAMVGDGADADWLDALEGCLLTDWEMRLDWKRFQDPFKPDLAKKAASTNLLTPLPRPT